MHAQALHSPAQFDRIVGSFAALVRIDKEYSYGDADDAFKEVAKTIGESSAKVLELSIQQRKELEMFSKERTKFEDFNVLRTLGEGGFGKVLLVSKKIPGIDEPERFALKVLKKSFIVDSGNVTRALAEKELLQSVQVSPKTKPCTCRHSR